MRTIKFRGKAKNFLPDKRRFVYGSLSDWGDGRLSIRWRVISSETAWKTCGVIPETVGQFTGLLDKNGREIYEGDILRFANSDSGVCEVRWNDSVSAFCIRFHFEHELGLKPLGSWQECERDIVIIGNIHDNPELLKGN